MLSSATAKWPADAEAGMYDEADDVSDLEDELAELQEETDNTLII